MGKNQGRPPKAIKQEKNIGFFVTWAEYAIIQQKVAQAGVNISDYMRQAAINAVVKTRWTAEERDLFKALVGLANDMNQVIKITRQEGSLHAILYFERHRTLMDKVIKQFGHDQ